MIEQKKPGVDVGEIIRIHPNVIIGKENCRFCVKAKRLLDREQILYKYIDWNECPEFVEKLKRESNHMTFPKIFLNGAFIGGYSDLKRLYEK